MADDPETLTTLPGVAPLTLTSPNGTKWAIVVDDNGVLSVAAVVN